MNNRQHETEVYFGSATSLKSQPETEVRLTKFNSISVDNDESIDLSQKLQHIQKSARETKSLSAVDLLESPMVENESSRANRWFWFRSNADQVANGVCSIVANQLTEEAAAAPIKGEPFQIVWSRLSFEVQLSSYDKFMNKSMHRISSLWPSKATTTNKQDHLDNAEKGNSLESLSNLERRVIFENLNGFVKSGEISAILGPSGAGKTSLLNAICGKTDNYRGSIQLVGGGKRRMRLSIIPQKDYLNNHLTVRENLLYSSKLLNTSKEFDHDANIMRVVKMLNLVSCFESSAANISGGEYKRVSIAQELLRQPDILILDEPTSGLDSLNCKKLIKSLVQLIEASQKGTFNPIAIVMTIHQPDVELFQMFDHVYCMARHGKVIFDGHPRDAMRILCERSGITENQLVPDSGIVNPANLLIEIASRDVHGQEPIDKLANYQRSQFELSSLAELDATRKILKSATAIKLDQTRANNIKLEASSKPQESNNGFKSLSNSSLLLFQNSSDIPMTDSKFKINSAHDQLVSQTGLNSLMKQQNSLIRDKRLTMKNDHSGKFWHHTRLLASRAFISTIRDPLMTVSSLLFHLLIPFVMWTVYNQKIGKVTACPSIQRELDMVSLASNNTLGKVRDQHEQMMSALECSTMFFLSTYSFSMCSLTVAALAFPLNMHILLKEVRNGWYSLSSFVVAKTISSFPFEVLFPVISIVMIYIMLGMPSAYLEWRLWGIALVMAFVSMISNTQGLIFGALCMDSVQSAIFLASASSLPLTLLSGFTARIKEMPILLQRLSWFSLYRYSSDSISIIRFGFNMCPCTNSTAEYLRSKAPTFVDLPQNMKPLFAYYLNTANSDSTTSDELATMASSNVTELITGLSTGDMTTLAPSSTAELLSNSIVNTTASYLADLVEFIPGVSKELTLNSSARSDLLRKIESNEVDLFERMANLMARSFTYGRELDSCQTVRSELLMSAGAPEDEFLPFLFGGMLGLLVAAKVILFIIVRFKIGKRV